jgi:hypothetical protein
MTRLTTLLCAGLCAMAFAVAANPAQAVGSNQVSYVSNTGSDTNGCTNPTTDACATFSGALAKTAAVGEIDCVNAGNYGGATGFTIAQSVTIDCAGGVGFSVRQISVSGDGIVVRLRNLSVNREGIGSWAIEGANMAALYIENCVITNGNGSVESAPPNVGIYFVPAANAQLFVTNSIISNNGGGGGVTGGIYIAPTSGAIATVVIDGSQINGNFFGIGGDGRSGGIIKGTIKNSVVSGNTENGITALSSGSSVVFMVDQTEVSGNLAGLFAGGSNAGMLARNTTVFNNTVGLDTTGGGTLYTYGNNSVNGNTTNGAFTGTAALQ